MKNSEKWETFYNLPKLTKFLLKSKSSLFVIGRKNLEVAKFSTNAHQLKRYIIIGRLRAAARGSARSLSFVKS